jgi:ribosomal protein S18 acetylase RimI-like enzyme
MNVSIRELREEDDLDAVLSLCKAFFDESEAHHEEFFATDGLRDDHLSGRFLNSITSDSTSTIIALVDNTIVGYASIAVRDQPDFYMVKRVGAISGLMVKTAFRRQGIATRLLAEAKHWFRQKGVKYFTVYTAVGNVAAVEFYRRNGMQPLHTTLIGEITQEQD